MASEVALTDWSEHGLGQYIDPIGPHGNRPNRTADGRRTWIVEAWRFLLDSALGLDPPLPDWADRFALTQFTVSSPMTARWFAGRDAGREWTERMRPGAFGLLAQPAEFLAGSTHGILPAAPYSADPQQWPDLDWYDRAGPGRPIRISTVDPVQDPIGFAKAVERGYVLVKTLGDVLLSYDRRPEHKSLAPDGTPAGPTTSGLLQRRPIHAVPALTHLAGKEGNKFLERSTGQVSDPADYRTEFGTRVDPWSDLVVPALQGAGPAEIARRTSGSWLRSLEDYAAARRRPHDARDAVVVTAVAAWAAKELGVSGELYTILARWKQDRGSRLCACGCGRPVVGRERWLTDAHRKTARRHANPAPD